MDYLHSNESSKPPINYSLADTPYREARDFTPDEKRARAHAVFIRLALPPYTIHFKSPTYLQPATLDLLDKRVCKETLRLTAQDVWVRTGIGTDARFWYEFVALLKAARPSLERRSFQGWDPGSVDYDSTSGALIASHYPGLWRDIERLNDIVSVSRNVLTIGLEAQEHAANYATDLEIFHLINCCVRVTARGYDGNAGTGEEEKWQWVVNAYKKLLITSLQFLNNLVAQNEKRKSMLWTSLFDHTSEAGFLEEDVVPRPIPTPKRPSPPISSSDILLAYGQNGPNQRISPLEYEAAQLMCPEDGSFLPMPANAAAAKKHAEPNGYVYFVSQHRAQLDEDFKKKFGRGPTLAEIHRNLPHYWHVAMKANKRLWAEWQGKFEKALDYFRDMEDDYQDYARDPEGWKEQYKADMEGRVPVPPMRTGKPWEPEEVEARIRVLEQQMVDESKHECIGHGYCEDPAECEKRAKASGITNPLDPRTASEQVDLKMLFTAEAGTKILESGKAELMKRLEGYGEPGAERRGSMARSAPVTGSENGHQRVANGAYRRRSSSYAVEDSFAEASIDDEEEDEEDEAESEEGEEQDDEEDYPGSTEDGRGLLTDVPLILGPSEIEVLPMLIMSGIVVPPAEEHPSRRNCYRSIDPDITGRWDMPDDEVLFDGAKLRVHLLLSQTPGRNLLRELLIFVAAWDLREEELYFKFMVRILEAILENGLMPYAYHAFRDRSRSKDIISPAQAVIMKLLTCIFRQRNENIRKHLRGEHLEGEFLQHVYLTNVLKRNIERPDPPDDLEWLRDQHLDAVEMKKELGLLPSATDIRLLNFVFTEFRQHIIPQTCALIFLQGQIHRGRASPDDFPLNLWDMERMYEGVYQFLEFFAVLSEEQGKVYVGLDGMETELRGYHVWNEEEQKMAMGGVGVIGWKGILAQWEMCCELVTLLRELEGGIPKVGDGLPMNMKRVAVHTVPASTVTISTTTAEPQMQRSLSADAIVGAGKGKQPVSVERPFDIDHVLPPSLAPGHKPASTSVLEPEAPLAFPEDPNRELIIPQPPPDLNTQPHHDQDEPSDFEWRNLKKLTVLVLSSLIWKNPLVQEQLRRYGGLEALVGCCRHDENNPYIREHAIMCLRFAVEGCEENADVLVRLAGERGRGSASDGVRKALAEVEGGGAESKAPSASTAGLKGGMIRDWASLKSPFDLGDLLPSLTAAGGVAGVATTATGSTPAITGPSGKTPAEEGRDLIRNAILNFPLKPVESETTVEEWHRSEALERLDRAFESTEAALEGTVLGESSGKGKGKG